MVALQTEDDEILKMTVMPVEWNMFYKSKPYNGKIPRDGLTSEIHFFKT